MTGTIILAASEIQNSLERRSFSTSTPKADIH